MKSQDLRGALTYDAAFYSADPYHYIPNITLVVNLVAKGNLGLGLTLCLKYLNNPVEVNGLSHSVVSPFPVRSEVFQS